MAELDKYFQDMWDRAESPTVFVNEILYYYRLAPDADKKHGADCIPPVAHVVRKYTNEHEGKEATLKEVKAKRSGYSLQPTFSNQLQDSLREGLTCISAYAPEAYSTLNIEIKHVDEVRNYLSTSAIPNSMKAEILAIPDQKDFLIVLAGLIVAENSKGFKQLKGLSAFTLSNLLSIACSLYNDHNTPVQIISSDEYFNIKELPAKVPYFRILGKLLFSLPTEDGAFSYMEANEKRIRRLCGKLTCIGNDAIRRDSSIRDIMKYVTMEMPQKYCTREEIEQISQYGKSKSDDATGCICFIAGKLLQAISADQYNFPKLTESIGGILYSLADYLNYTEMVRALLITEVEYRNLRVVEETDASALGRKFFGIN